MAIFRRVRSPAKRSEEVKVVIIIGRMAFNGLNWLQLKIETSRAQRIRGIRGP
jgi:hypothetical protein